MMDKQMESYNIDAINENGNDAEEANTKSLFNHWSNIYKNSDISKLGWYEVESKPSLKLIEKCNLSKKALILNVGAGSTTLIDSLLERGFTNLIANDISAEALNKIKSRIGKNKNSVQWIVDDLINPTALNKIPKVDVWNDRALLHFFIEKSDQDAYFDLLHKTINKNGYVILAVFNLEGAKKCSGLPVKRYDAKMLQEKLGSSYILKDSFNYIYTMPNGDDRNYVYTLFQKI